jgi:endonuclease/exonuclease/phosphatase family metal-dependent hydrolase
MDPLRRHPPWAWMAVGGALACAGPNPVELRVGTFNLRNLTASSPEATRQGVARIVQQSGAEVLLLEEVAGPGALEALAAQDSLSTRFPYRIALPGNDLRGFGLGWLSTLPPVKVRSHAEDRFSLVGEGTGRTFRYTRDCQELHLEWGGRRLTLLGVHFRAQLVDDPEHRWAEAQHTRRIADGLVAEDPELYLAVLGDFNDSPGSPTREALESQWTWPLFSTAAALPASERWSVDGATSGTGELFDDLLVNPPLWHALRPASVRILHDHDLLAELAGVSDHAPVTASFAWPSQD